MDTLQYSKSMHKVFELYNKLSLPIRKNDKYPDTNWETKDKAFS